MNTFRQRRLGIRLLSAYKDNANVAPLIAMIRSRQCCVDSILKKARTTLGADRFVDVILHGHPEWAYRSLLRIPDLGMRRDELLEKVCEEPREAHFVLRYVSDVSAYRERLVQTVALEYRWARCVLQTVHNLSEDERMLLEATPNT